MSEAQFEELFTRERPVVFAFHGYRYAVHQLVHGRPDPARFHVRGFMEQGTTTTPFDMVVMNEMSRFHLAALALRHSSLAAERTAPLIAELEERIRDAVRYSREHLQDQPEVRDWSWTTSVGLGGRSQ
jgi:xylulose-5-phosphate/fructose-6-phosphate phosphoketolase